MGTFLRERNSQDLCVEPDTKRITDGEFGTVLVLYTGGTIGMKIKDAGGKLVAKAYQFVFYTL